MKKYYYIIIFVCLLSCTYFSSCFGPIPSVSCSLSTPVISDNQVNIPFELCVQGKFSSSGDTLRAWFVVAIKVKNSETGLISSYTQEIHKELDEDHKQYSGILVFNLADNERYVNGSADVIDDKSYYNYGFICSNYQIHKSNNCFNLSRLLSQFLQFC